MPPLLGVAVQHAATVLQGVHDVQGGDGLALAALGEGDGVTDDLVNEALQHLTHVLVDEPADATHTTTAGQAADAALGHTADVSLEEFLHALGGGGTLGRSGLSLGHFERFFFLFVYLTKAFSYRTIDGFHASQ